MVGERVVLRGVEDLEQRARRIALERDAELVDLVEQEHRVLGARLLHALEDAARASRRCRCGGGRGCRPRRARRRARCGRTCGPSRARSTSRSRSCRRPEGPANSRIRPLPALRRFGVLRSAASRRPQLAHGEELEHAILDVAEPVVILVEDPRGLARRRGARRCACPTAARRSSRGRCGSPATPSTRGRCASGAPTRARPPCAPPRAAERVELGLQLLRGRRRPALALAELLLDRRICSRRSISRCRPPSSSLTLDWMSSWAERTSIWRCTWTSTRRRRSSTESVSSSCWRSATACRGSRRRGRRGARARRPARASARPPRRAGRASRRAPRRARAPPGAARRSGVLRVERRHLGRLRDRLEHLAVLRRHAHGDAALLPSSTRRTPPRPRWTEPSFAIVPIV